MDQGRPTANGDVRERTIQEGQVQAKLRHPHVVSVTDVLDIDGSPGLLMEFVRGPALDHWLFQYQPSIEEVLVAPVQPEPSTPPKPGVGDPIPRVPVPPKPKELENSGSFTASGATAATWVLDGKSYSVGQPLPPGRYAIVAGFDGGAPSPAGRVTVKA